MSKTRRNVSSECMEFVVKLPISVIKDRIRKWMQDFGVAISGKTDVQDILSDSIFDVLYVAPIASPTMVGRNVLIAARWAKDYSKHIKDHGDHFGVAETKMGPDEVKIFNWDASLMETDGMFPCPEQDMLEADFLRLYPNAQQLISKTA